jgi:hypothetical protein
MLNSLFVTQGGLPIIRICPDKSVRSFSQSMSKKLASTTETRFEVGILPNKETASLTYFLFIS